MSGRIASSAPAETLPSSPSMTLGLNVKKEAWALAVSAPRIDDFVEAGEQSGEGPTVFLPPIKPYWQKYQPPSSP